jgi:hypothetical protein
MPEKNWLRILALQLLQPLGIGQVHPAILGLQLAERRWDQPMLRHNSAALPNAF